MKTHTLTTALLLLSLLLSRPLLAQNEVKEQLVVPLSDPGKPGNLHVGLINGSIHVIGYSGKDVVIDIVASPKRGRREDNDDRPDRTQCRERHLIG